MKNSTLIFMLSLLLAPYLILQSIPLYYHIRYFRHRHSQGDDKK